MDNTDLVLRMLSDMKSDMSTGFGALNDRLDTLNGRTRKAESDVAILNERTSKMTCVAHELQLKDIPVRMAELDNELKTLSAAPMKSHAKTGVISGASVAALIAVAEGVWTWYSR